MSIINIISSFGGDSPDIEPITFSPIPFITDFDYMAFGNVVKINNDKYYWLGRNGTTHVNGGKIFKCEYTPSSKSITKRLNIITPLTNDVRGGSHGLINGSIFHFTALYSGSTFLDIGYYKSADGLTGEIYHEYVSLDSFLTYSRYNFYGTPQRITDLIWIIPWYEHDGAGTWKNNFIKTVDGGENFTNHTISEGLSPVDIGETSILYLGNNKLLALGRKRAGDFLLYQNYSTDLGATWGGWDSTNLGSGLDQCMPNVYLNSKGLIDCIYADRGTTYVKISIDNPTTIVSNPTSWSTPKNIYESDSGFSFAPLGYPSILEISQGRYIVFLSQEVKDTTVNTEAKLYIGDGHLNDL